MTSVPSDEAAAPVTEELQESAPAPIAQPRIASWKLWGLVFLPLIVLYLNTATVDTDKLSPDPVAAAQVAWRITNYQDIDLAGRGQDTIWIQERGNGVRTSDRSPGVIGFGVPFFWLIGRDPLLINMQAAALAAAFAAAAAMATLALLLRRLTTTKVAVGATALMALGTSTWGVSADALWPHGPNQLFLAVAMLGAANGLWLLTGTVFALAILTRAHLASVAAVTGIWLSLKRRAWSPVVAIGAFSVTALLAVIAYTNYLSGRLDVSPSGISGTHSLRDNGWDHMAANTMGFFVSPSRGLLVICPFLLLLLPGLPRAWRAAPTWVRAFAAGGVLYLLIQAKLNHFSGGVRFWGPRLTLESLTLWAPLLLLCWTQWTSLRAWRIRLFLSLAILAVGYQAIGAIYFDAPPFLTDPWSHNWVVDVLRRAPYRAPARGIAIAAVVLALNVLVVPVSRRAPKRAALPR